MAPKNAHASSSPSSIRSRTRSSGRTPSSSRSADAVRFTQTYRLAYETRRSPHSIAMAAPRPSAMCRSTKWLVALNTTPTVHPDCLVRHWHLNERSKWPSRGVDYGRQGGPMSRRLLLTSAALGFALYPCDAHAAPVACNSLMKLSLPQATITAAEEIPAGEYTPQGSGGFGPGAGRLSDLPAFCRVALTVQPQIHIEVWLPKDKWNGNYRGEGGGGYAGAISYGGLAEGIRRGYATASTDTGHPASAGGTFALNADGTLNMPLIGDFAERSLRDMALKAKAIVRAYYGSAPKHSYWNGCSTGGRQGLMAAQRFPAEYDGLVIGAPAINWDRFIPSELWPQILMNKTLGAPISAAKLTAVTRAAVAA